MERKLVYQVEVDTIDACATSTGQTQKQVISALAGWINRMVGAYDPGIKVLVLFGADGVTEYPQPPEGLRDYKYRWLAGLFAALASAEEGWRLEMATK